jgi:hypothetical protein
MNAGPPDDGWGRMRYPLAHVYLSFLLRLRFQHGA